MMAEFELFPIMSGLVVGWLLPLLRPSLQRKVGIPLAVVLGVLATIVSGEFKISWGYLLIDIPLVGISASAGFLSMQWLRPRVMSRP